MNPLLFADWSHVHRVSRGLMWMVAGALVVVVFFAVSSRAAGGHAHVTLRDGAQITVAGPQITGPTR
jgi:hypothetical protein